MSLYSFIFWIVVILAVVVIMLPRRRKDDYYGYDKTAPKRTPWPKATDLHQKVTKNGKTYKKVRFQYEDGHFEDKEIEVSYNEVLNDKRWVAKRAQIINRDGHECQWCHTHGTKKNPLQVHHKWYKMKNGNFIDPWDYPDSCYITLCKNCHEFAHKKRKPPIHYE